MKKLILIFLCMSSLTHASGRKEQKAEGDAVVVGKVAKVECSERTKESQAYSATIEVSKTIRGKVESPLKIPFVRYFDGKPRLGDNGISFLKGDVVELTLTRYKDYWAVQFPFHKKEIQVSAGMLPVCK